MDDSSLEQPLKSFDQFLLEQAMEAAEDGMEPEEYDPVEIAFTPVDEDDFIFKLLVVSEMEHELEEMVDGALTFFTKFVEDEDADDEDENDEKIEESVQLNEAEVPDVQDGEESDEEENASGKIGQKKSTETEVEEVPEKKPDVKGMPLLVGTRYDNWKTNPNPMLMILGKFIHPRTRNMLVCAINTNYLTAGEVKTLVRDQPKIYKESLLRRRYWVGRQLQGATGKQFKVAYRHYYEEMLHTNSGKVPLKVSFVQQPDLKIDEKEYARFRHYVNLEFVKHMDRRQKQVHSAMKMRMELRRRKTVMQTEISRKKKQRELRAQHRQITGKRTSSIVVPKKTSHKPKVHTVPEPPSSLSRLTSAEKAALANLPPAKSNL